MIVEDEEIEAVQIESTRTIDIDQFVPKNEIDERYVDSPYYIAPDGAVGQEAFAVIRDTIAKLNMVALGRVVLARREGVPPCERTTSNASARVMQARRSRGKLMCSLWANLGGPYWSTDEHPTS